MSGPYNRPDRQSLNNTLGPAQQHIEPGRNKGLRGADRQLADRTGGDSPAVQAPLRPPEIYLPVAAFLETGRRNNENHLDVHNLRLPLLKTNFLGRSVRKGQLRSSSGIKFSGVSIMNTRPS